MDNPGTYDSSGDSGLVGSFEDPAERRAGMHSWVESPETGLLQRVRVGPNSVLWKNMVVGWDSWMPQLALPEYPPIGCSGRRLEDCVASLGNIG